VVLVGSPVAAQGAPDISAQPASAQLDVLQGTAIELDGSPKSGKPVPTAYRWEIVSGDGAGLYSADQPVAIFQAPIIDRRMEMFAVQLEVDYPDDQDARATVLIRVHRELEEPAPEEPSIEDVMTEYYRAEKEAREAKKRSSKNTSPVVIQHGYRGFHGGYGYGWGGWGWPSYSVVHAPIVIPPPGNDWDVAVPLPEPDW
jgi:hypothetical protein